MLLENAVKIHSLAQELGATGIKVRFRPKTVRELPSSEKPGLDYWTPVAFHKYSFNTPEAASAFQARLKTDFKIKPLSYAGSDEIVHSLLSGPKTVEIHNQGIDLDAKTQSKVAGAVAKIKLADVAKAIACRLPGRKKHYEKPPSFTQGDIMFSPWSLYGENPDGIYPTMNRTVGSKFSEMVVARKKARK